MEGAQSEQSDGEQVTPMDFLLLTYPAPDTWKMRDERDERNMSPTQRITWEDGTREEHVTNAKDYLHFVVTSCKKGDSELPIGVGEGAFSNHLMEL